MSKRLFSRSVFAVVLFSMSLSAVSPSYATDKGGVKVGGDLTQVTLVKTATNLAIGEGSTAAMSVGAIHGNTDIGGDLTQVTLVKTATNLALGKDSTACMQIGSIGDNPACK